jgi:hypothetical protein
VTARGQPVHVHHLQSLHGRRGPVPALLAARAAQAAAAGAATAGAALGAGGREGLVGFSPELAAARHLRPRVRMFATLVNRQGRTKQASCMPVTTTQFLSNLLCIDVLHTLSATELHLCAPRRNTDRRASAHEWCLRRLTKSGEGRMIRLCGHSRPWSPTVVKDISAPAPAPAAAGRAWRSIEKLSLNICGCVGILQVTCVRPSTVLCLAM